MSYVFLKGWRLGLVELIYERFMMRYILRKVCKDFPSILLPSFALRTRSARPEHRQACPCRRACLT